MAPVDTTPTAEAVDLHPPGDEVLLIKYSSVNTISISIIQIKLRLFKDFGPLYSLPRS